MPAPGAMNWNASAVTLSVIGSFVVRTASWSANVPWSTGYDGGGFHFAGRVRVRTPGHR
jgi:hypothetical protein